MRNVVRVPEQTIRANPERGFQEKEKVGLSTTDINSHSQEPL
jgi:hypothetical protein